MSFRTSPVTAESFGRGQYKTLYHNIVARYFSLLFCSHRRDPERCRGAVTQYARVRFWSAGATALDCLPTAFATMRGIVEREPMHDTNAALATLTAPLFTLVLSPLAFPIQTARRVQHETRGLRPVARINNRKSRKIVKRRKTSPDQFSGRLSFFFSINFIILIT